MLKLIECKDHDEIQITDAISVFVGFDIVTKQVKAFVTEDNADHIVVIDPSEIDELVAALMLAKERVTKWKTE